MASVLARHRRGAGQRLSAHKMARLSDRVVEMGGKAARNTANPNAPSERLSIEPPEISAGRKIVLKFASPMPISRSKDIQLSDFDPCPKKLVPQGSVRKTMKKQATHSPTPVYRQMARRCYITFENPDSGSRRGGAKGLLPRRARPVIDREVDGGRLPFSAFSHPSCVHGRSVEI